MFAKLRIIFTILAAIALALALPAGAIWSWPGILSCGVVALFFFVAMLFCKSAQENAEEKKKSLPLNSNEELNSPNPNEEN